MRKIPCEPHLPRRQLRGSGFVHPFYTCDAPLGRTGDATFDVWPDLYVSDADLVFPEGTLSAIGKHPPGRFHHIDDPPDDSRIWLGVDSSAASTCEGAILILTLIMSHANSVLCGLNSPEVPIRNLMFLPKAGLARNQFTSLKSRYLRSSHIFSGSRHLYCNSSEDREASTPELGRTAKPYISRLVPFRNL